MHENDLCGGFKEVHKLVVLVLTIPYSTASLNIFVNSSVDLSSFISNAFPFVLFYASWQ